ncbi:MAG: hypothetical protein AAGK97_05955, partial [Bacteroidota bacterium]
FPNPPSIQKVSISLLSDPNAWIFKPESISLYLDNIELSTIKLSKTLKGENAQNITIPFTLKKDKSFQRMEFKIKHIASIPEWHVGKGNPAWLFIDEIIFE